MGGWNIADKKLLYRLPLSPLTHSKLTAGELGVLFCKIKSQPPQLILLNINEWLVIILFILRVFILFYLNAEWILLMNMASYIYDMIWWIYLERWMISWISIYDIMNYLWIFLEIYHMMNSLYMISWIIYMISWISWSIIWWISWLYREIFLI